MEITFDRRFRGPLTSANGGFACGSLAAFVDAGEVEVTLRLPPPLGRPLQVRTDDGSAALLDGDDVVAEARAAPLEVEVPAPVSVAEAEDATTRFVAIGSPLFGECFVCGTREDGDGLGVHAGPVASRAPLLASPWTAREPSRAVVWAAIDCPGAYAVGVAGRGEIVLGSPLAALGYLVELLAKQPQAPPLAAGEIISTGTLTDAHPVAPGETWSTEIRGLPLAGLQLAFS